ncbi:hypothetical protein N9N12_01435 [Candidatus Poseidoniales archaeon]|nr:hypothetical protein [Candidatus Poseidoniales archaeon]
MATNTTTENLGKTHQVEFTTEIDVSVNNIYCQVYCADNDVNFAFYLVVDGITTVKRWYKADPNCSFRLEHDRTKEHSVVFFVRDSKGNIFKKTEVINQHYIDFIPSCSIEEKSIRCQIETSQQNTEYAFYLYLNDEKVVKKWYTREKQIVFEMGDAPIQSVEVKYFVRDKKRNIFSKTSGFKRYEPSMNDERSRTNFDFFLSIDGEVIYKKVNLENKRFSDKLRAHGGVDRFRQILKSHTKTQISNHVAKGFEIENDGSYKSKYIHGYRLDLLSSVMNEYPSLNLPSYEERADIKVQCERLILALKEADSAGKLSGDWALHNLIYSPQENCIFNIDLEGFITYNPLPEWADLGQILTWIENFLRQLEA